MHYFILHSRLFSLIAPSIYHGRGEEFCSLYVVLYVLYCTYIHLRRAYNLTDLWMGGTTLQQLVERYNPRIRPQFHVPIPISYSY